MCVLHSNDERCSSLVNETSSINFVFQDIDLWMNIDAIGILFTWKMFRILFSIEILSSFYSNILLVFSSLHQFRAKQPTFVFWLCLCFYWVRVLKRAIGFFFVEHLQFKSHTTITRMMCVSCRYEHGWKHHLENHWIKERCPGENNQIKQTTFGDM